MYIIPCPSPIDSEQQNLCGGKLANNGCLEALNSVASDKYPGTDDLPADAYRVFWKSLSAPLLKAFNYGGQFAVLQRRGVITLIPKKDADLYLIKKIGAPSLC